MIYRDGEPTQFPFKYSEYIAIAKASIDIISYTIHEMTSSDEHLNCVKALLEMFLVTNAGVKYHQDKNEKQASGTTGVITEILNWLKSSSVVGPPFGTGRFPKKDKMNTELKVP